MKMSEEELVQLATGAIVIDRTDQETYTKQEDGTFVDRDGCWWSAREVSIFESSEMISSPFKPSEKPAHGSTPKLTREEMGEFALKLLAGDEAVVNLVYDFFHPQAPDPEEFSAILTGPFVIDENGFHKYRVNHGLNSTEVSLDINGAPWSSYRQEDPKTIILVSPARLSGSRVRVWKNR